MISLHSLTCYISSCLRRYLNFLCQNSLFFSSWQIYSFRLWSHTFFKVQCLQSKLETRGVHLLPMVLPPFSYPNLLGPRNTPVLHMSFPELPCLPPASWYHLPLQKFLFTLFSPPYDNYFFSCIQHETLLHILHHLAQELLAPCFSLMFLLLWLGKGLGTSTASLVIRVGQVSLTPLVKLCWWRPISLLTWV